MKSQLEFQLIISDTLGHHNQGWPRNLHLKLFLSIYLLKNNRLLIWNNFIISLKENIVFVKLFETSFGSNIIASFTEFQWKGTDTFGFIRVQTFGNHIQDNFLHK